MLPLSDIKTMFFHAHRETGTTTATLMCMCAEGCHAAMNRHLHIPILWPPYEQPHSLCRQTHHIGVLLSPQLLPQHCHCGYLEGGSVIQSNDACIGGHTNSDPERLAGGRIINLGGGINNSKSKASDVFSMAQSTNWCPTDDHVSITNGLQLQGNIDVIGFRQQVSENYLGSRNSLLPQQWPLYRVYGLYGWRGCGCTICSQPLLDSWFL